MTTTFSELVITRGFDPKLETRVFFGCFSLKEAKRSLFNSTRYEHVTVYLTSEEDQVRLPVVIDLAQPRFIDSVDDGEMPDWYFEGWILEPGKPGVERVRIYVCTTNYDKKISDDDIFLWQMIPNRTKLPLDASIRKLKLDKRTTMILLQNGVTTIGDAVEYSRRHNFSDIPDIGRVRTAELTKEMEAAGHPLM